MAFSIEDKVFRPIDGRELDVSKYFTLKDFAIEGNSGFIKHDALLRVCKELFSIRKRTVNIIEAPTELNGKYACAIVGYELESKEDNVAFYEFESSADCTPVNKPPKPADIYFTAMAETRASGRALRFLLGVDFCTKEEIGTRNIEDSGDFISKNVVTVIEKKFMQQHGINMEQMRKLLKKSEEEMPDLNCLTIEEGAKLMQKLNQNVVKLSKGD